MSRPVQELDKRDELFSGGGAMGAVMRSMDWSETALGSPNSWSQALRAMVGLLLRNRSGFLLWWGPQFIQLYNDAYRPVLGDKHPRSMGQPAKECWAEIWNIIGPMIEAPFRGEPATTSDDLILLMDRRGFMEETHFKVAYSPVPDESVGATGIGGVLATIAETTEQVYGERQLRTLRELGAHATDAKTASQACATAGAALKENGWDVPFALFYLLDEDSKRIRLASSVGFDAASKADPAEIDLAAADTGAAWPIASVLADARPEVLENLIERFGLLPAGRWSQVPHAAIALPLASPESPQAYGVLICGLSPHRTLDTGYRTFFELAAIQVAVAIRNARSFEVERKRAEALAELDRAKTTFFSNVSHELRTPLTLMLGPTEDLLSGVHGEISAAQRAQLELLRRNELRLQRLVNALLELSRIEAGRVQAAYEATDLAALTRDLASAFRSAIERAGLTFTVDCPTLDEQIFLDRDIASRVLVADDNADMREYLCRILGAHWVVEAVGDGAAALQAARESRPDLIVTDDAMMPELDGFRLLRALREDASTRAIPVIMLSARAGEEAQVEGLKAGADDYLVKPFSARALVTRVTANITASRLRQTLDAERVKLHSLFENAPAIICALKGPDHVFDSTNLSCLRFIGHRHVLGMPVRAAFPELEAQGFFMLLDEVYRTGQPRYGNEARMLIDSKGDGELDERFVNFVCYPSRTAQDEVDGILVFGFDVTAQVLARRKVEEERRSAQAAQAKAESAVRAHDEFLTVASHELRTPLTTLGLQIDGLLRALRHPSASDPRWIGKVEKLRAQADRLEKLIENMLDVVVLSRERLKLECEDVDLLALARSVIGRLRSESKQARSSLEVAGSSVVGRWDKRRLEQILDHLLSNALKFGAGRPINVLVESTGETARLSVVDHGIGISAEHHDQIFGRFKRATSTNNYGGLGLGLWIVRELVTAMGGSIVVVSEPGRGSTFVVELPRQA